METEIIAFPLDKIVNRPWESEEDKLEAAEADIETRLSLMRSMQIERVMEIVMPMLFCQLSIGGFDLSDEKTLKDAAFITEAVRCVLFKINGMEHPFQQLIEKLFIDEEGGILTIAGKIDLDLNPPQEVVPT